MQLLHQTNCRGLARFVGHLGVTFCMLKLDNHKHFPIVLVFISSFISVYKRYTSILDRDNNLSIPIINYKLVEKWKCVHNLTKGNILFETIYIIFFPHRSKFESIWMHLLNSYSVLSEMPQIWTSGPQILAWAPYTSFRTTSTSCPTSGAITFIRKMVPIP